MMINRITFGSFL